MPPLAPASALTDDLIDEIILRLPPDDPGCLFRASLVCKRLRRLLTGRDFAGRYRGLHRSPPLLGFFENQFLGCWFAAPSSPASRVPPIHPGHRCLDALDSRHGLVLLEVRDSGGDRLDRLAVWDPLRRRQWEFPFPPLGIQHHITYSASVLCAADGCDHLDCRARGSPFLVAFVCSDGEGAQFYASLYSSVARAWSPVTSCDCEHPVAAASLAPKSIVLVGNALCFACHCEQTVTKILRYDLASRVLSIINGPPAGSQANYNQYVLVGMGNGVLGFTKVQGSTLCVWSIQASADAAWGQHRVVELERLLPPRAFSAQICVTGFTEGLGVIVLTIAGTFTIDLKSYQVRDAPGRILRAFPYTSFCTPDQAGIMLHSPMASSENSEWRDDDDDEEEEYDVESGEELQNDLEQAQDMFDNWSKAIVDGDFDVANICAVSTLECRFACHGKLSPKCAYTYYMYGCTLLYKPQPNSEPSLERDDVEDMMSLPGNHDYNLAWKMLQIAKTILEKCPGTIIEKVKISSALADVKILSTVGRGTMRGEDKDYSLRVCFKALAISEHLIEPDNYWIIKLNVSICLIFEFASNTGDAAAYCAKAISLCRSRISNLEVAQEALLLDKGDNAFAAEAGSERSALEYEIEFLTGISCKLEKKLEHLEQAKPTPTTNPSDEQNVGAAMPRAASSTPTSDLLELLSIFDPVLRKTSCTPIWSELQGV